MEQSSVEKYGLLRLQRIERAAYWTRLFTVLVLLMMFVATHVPVSFPQTGLSNLDKLFHFTSYLFLAFCALASWELTVGTLRPAHYFTVWLIGMLYGLFDELTQIPVGRTCEGADWLADILGLIAGLTLFRLARPLLYRIARATL